MEKPIRKIHSKTRQEPDSSNFLVIYTLLLVITAILIATYYKKLKQRFGYLLKNFSLKNLYINLLDDPLENTDELNKKAKKIINSYGPFMYIQNLNYRILNIVNFKYSLSSFLNEIHSPLVFIKKIEEYLESIDYKIPNKINNTNKVKNKNKGKSPKIPKDNKNGSNQQINIQKKKKKQRQRLVYSDNNIASTSTSTIPSSPVPIFYESFIIQKASTSTSSSGTSLVTTVASIASSSTSTSSATTISSKSLSSSRKTLVASTPSITSINNMSYKSTSSIVSIVSENDKKKTYPIKNIEEKKKEEVEIEEINNHELHREDIIAIATTASTPSITIPTVPSTVVIQEIKDEEDEDEEEIKSNDCLSIDTKNVIKYSQPTTSVDAVSISSHSSIVGDDEDTCYDSYISSDVSDNYSSTSELSDSEDDVIILINPEPDLSQFLSPRRNQTKTETVSNNTNQKTYSKNEKFSKVNGEELKKYGQPSLKKEGVRRNYNEMEDKRNSINHNMSRRKEPSSTNKNNNTNSMCKKSTNSSTSSLQTLISSSHDDLVNINSSVQNANISLSPKPTTDMILSSFKEPYLVKSIISTTSSIQQSPSLSVSSVFSEQSDSSSATLVHPSYSQISTTSTFSTKDTLTASTTELTVKSSAILDKEQGQNVSPNINVNISINNNSSTTTSPLTNNTTTVNKSSVFYSSGPMRVSRRNRHYYPSVVSHSRSYGSSSLMQRHMIKPIRRGKNYGGNGPQGYTYYIPQHYLNNSNGTMTSPYCPLIYNAATPYIITTTTPNAQGLPVLSPMILYPTQAVATVVSSTPFNNSNYIIINNAPNLPNSSSALSTSSSLHKYGGYKRFNNNRKRRIYIPYFRKNNGHYYHSNNNNNNYTYKVNNRNLITNNSNDNVNSNNENINKDVNSNTNATPINRENREMSSNNENETECKVLSEMDIDNKENSELNNSENGKSLPFSGERRLFKSKRFNNQRIQKKNPYNMHKPTFHKTFKKSPIKTDSEYYYQPIPVVAQQQPNSQYVYFNNNNNNNNNNNSNNNNNNNNNKNNKNNNSKKYS